MSSGPEKNDKYAFLYEFTKGAFEGELQRYKNIEEKASKYMGFISILVVAYTAILRFSIGLFFPVDSALKWVAVFLIVFSYISIISAWSLLFRAVRFLEMPRIPCDAQTLEEFKKYSLPTMHLSLSKTCIDAKEKAREVNSSKVGLLVKAHNDIGVCTWAITLSLGVLVLLKITG